MSIVKSHANASICRDNIVSMPDLTYSADDDPKVRAWDDVGIEVL